MSGTSASLWTAMAYRDDRQAMALQLAELERENERLRDEIESFEEMGARYGLGLG